MKSHDSEKIVSRLANQTMQVLRRTLVRITKRTSFIVLSAITRSHRVDLGQLMMSPDLPREQKKRKKRKQLLISVIVRDLFVNIYENNHVYF